MGLAKASFRFLVLSSLIVLTLGQTFSLPDPLPRPPNLQVDQEGRAFVAAGSQLLRLSSSLVPEQTVNLSSVAVNISLSSGGEWLVVCTTDLSCAVHNASDLTAVSSTSEAALVNSNRVAVFTAGNSFYVGSAEVSEIRLRQDHGLDGSGIFERSTDYTVTRSTFQRDFFSGFLTGDNAYFVVTDHNPPNVRAIRIMRVCHVTGCPGGGSSSCGFTALYEENIVGCGSTLASDDDTVCGVSVVEDFAGVSGTGILISRCRLRSLNNNLVCLVRLSEVDSSMDSKYDECNAGTGELELAWRSEAEGVACSNIQVRVYIPLLAKMITINIC